MNKQIAELIAKMLDEYFDQIIPRLRAENEKAVGEVQKSILLANERLALVKESAVARDSVEDLIGRRFEDIKSVFESELKASILEIPPGARGKKGEPGRDAHFAPPVAYVSGKDYPYGTVAMYKSGLWFAQRATGQAPDDENSGWSVITQGVDDVDFVWDKDSGLRNFRLYITRSDGEHHSFEVKLPLADYKGVWKEGSFEQFDTVSHQGSAWICLADTDTKPGTDEGKDYWRLQVKSGKDGKAGGRGVSVVEAEKTASYDLIIKTSDGKKHNVGNVRGEKGEKGEKGDSVKGNKGDPGQRGQSGARGATFKDVAFDHEKELVIFHYKDGSSSTTSFQHFELAIRQAISPTSEFNKETGEVTVKTKSGMKLLEIPFADVISALNKGIQWTGQAQQNKSYVPGDLVSIGPAKVIICVKPTSRLPGMATVGDVEKDKNWEVFVWIEVTPGGGSAGASGGGGIKLIGEATVDEVNAFDPADINTNDAWVMEDAGTITVGSQPVDVIAGDMIAWTEDGYFVNFGPANAIPGPQGEAATIEVGTTTTGAAGTNAQVSNSGNENDAVFDFVIPKGDDGDPGPSGESATAEAGTTTTLPPGSDAQVINVGTTSDAVFDFAIPQGDKGDKGDEGTGYKLKGSETVAGLNATSAGDHSPGDAYIMLDSSPPDVQPSGASQGVPVAADDLIVWAEGGYFVNYGSQSGGGVTDHGNLTGLGDDDHPQYHNDTRGDARYYTKAQSNSNYATSAQGAKADSAVQPGDNVSELSNDAGYLDQDAGDSRYATSAQGDKADTALQNVSEDSSPDLGGELHTKNNDIIVEDGNGELGRVGSFPAKLGVFFARTSSGAYDENDGGLVAAPGRSELHGSVTQIPGLSGSADRQVYVSSDGALYGVDIPPQGFIENDTDTGVYGLPTLTTWVQIAGLSISLPQDVEAGAVLDITTALHLTNDSSRNGSIEIGVGVDGAQPAEGGQEIYLTEDFSSRVSASLRTSQHGGLVTGQSITVWARRISESNAAFDPVVDGTAGAANELTVSTPTTSGGGGVSDHGGLTGLADDDHAQYHNDARGDARYYTKAAADSAFATSGQGSAADSAMQPGDNVSDLANDAGYLDQTAGDGRYATTAQGALADSATQPGDNISTLNNDSGYLDDASAFATSAQGAKADSATQPGDNISTLNNDENFKSYESGAVLPDPAGYPEGFLFMVTPP